MLFLITRLWADYAQADTLPEVVRRLRKPRACRMSFPLSLSLETLVMLHVCSVLAVITLLITAADARSQGADLTLTDQQRREVILGLAELVEQNYVETQTGSMLASRLRANLNSGVYDEFTSPGDLASALTRVLRPHDRHFSVKWYPPESGKAVFGMHEEPTEENIRAQREHGRSQNFGFRKLEILSGNVGYLDLLTFHEIRDYPDAANTAIAAMNLLAHADAVIIDLRHNGGGEPNMVQLLMSYFIGPERHYNNLYWRKNEHTVQYWTLPHVPGPRIQEAPVYVLTSARTGSAAEAFAYHLQALKRATIIGDVSAGGANPGEGFWIASGFSAYISNGKAISPITGTNWEKVGVKPDIEVPAADALDRAYEEALQCIVNRVGPGKADEHLRWALEALTIKRKPVRLTPAQLDEYVGTYGSRKIRLAADRLTYQRGNRTVFDMVPLGDDRFLTIGKEDFRLLFKREQPGEKHGAARYVGGRPHGVECRKDPKSRAITGRGGPGNSDRVLRRLQNPRWRKWSNAKAKELFRLSSKREWPWRRWSATRPWPSWRPNPMSTQT